MITYFREQLKHLTHWKSRVISCDKNLNRCCELVKLTSKIQGQLFTILNLTAREGGHYAGVDVLKSRLLPWLGICFPIATSSVTNNTSLNLIQESVKKEWKIRVLSATHESDMQKMDTLCMLCSTHLQLESRKQELRAARDQVETYKRKLNVLDDSESQGRLLRDEVSFLTAEKSMLQERLVRSRSTSPLPRHSHHSSPLRSESPTRAQLNNSSRHAWLVSRFSDLYAVERLEAQSLLRRYIDDLEIVQRIIFIATVEAFQAAKLAYCQFKQHVRKTLSPSHQGPEILGESVASVNDVISNMNVNPRISFSPEVDFVLISSFIKETCRVAFTMQTLDSPLDLAFTSDPELWNSTATTSQYHRSYDSEFTAPLVVYHVWPAMVEGDSVIVKGEVVTRRGALKIAAGKAVPV
uniref:Mitochondria-eating protein n=1 Tax=Oncorhynchus tshawytscha TaxID=74940 RepID=A0A8C8FKR2_ONCTS